jgi:hypothetical protein
MIQFSESSYSNYIAYNGNIANFEFFTQSGSVIPAWIESNQSGNLIIWVKLANGIPASSNTIIYLGFASKTTNLLSSSGTSGIGEAPKLSSTYAQYDDGASVFNNYWNFAGTSLPSGWTSALNGGSINIHNGLTISSSSSKTTLAISPSITPLSNGEIFEQYVNVPSSINYGLVAGYGTTSSSTDTQNGYFGGFDTDISTASGIWRTSSGSFSQLASASFPGAGTYILGLSWAGSSLVATTNYNSFASATSTTFSLSQVNQIVLRNANADGTSTTYWLRTRAYPPSGVMPSYSFGSVV